MLLMISDYASFPIHFSGVKLFEWINDHFNRKPLEPLNRESRTIKQGAEDGQVRYSKIQMQTTVLSRC